MKPGEAWGEPFTGSVDLDISGTDADLARVVEGQEGALVRFRAAPGSDFARSVGIAGPGVTGQLAAPIDALRVDPGGVAVNGIVVGTPPGRIRATTPSARLTVRVNGRSVWSGRATTVVVANGQFFDGMDVVPRGHPGDGRIEVQVYALRRGERRAMRARLPQGVHLPHPRIATATGREVEIAVDGRPVPLTIDGIVHERAGQLTVRVIPGALRLVL